MSSSPFRSLSDSDLFKGKRAGRSRLNGLRGINQGEPAHAPEEHQRHQNAAGDEAEAAGDSQCNAHGAGGGSRFNPRRYILLAILVPTLIHGTWDYLCTVGTVISTVIFFAMVIALYIVCFARIRAVSKADSHEYNTTMELLNYQYPGLPQDAVNAAYYSVKFGNYR